MKTFLKYALLAVLWGAVGAYVVYAAATSQRKRAQRRVTELQIEVADSTALGQLVSSARVREWITGSGISTLGTAVDKVDLTGIEELIARNGFVKQVEAHVSYSGVLHIAISQRKPVVRILTDGYDAYATSEGYVFAAPKASSLYVPVVTGSYQPPFFKAGYAGTVRGYIDLQQRKIDEQIAQLEKQKYPFYKKELQNDRDISALRRKRVKRQWWRMESAAEYDQKVAALREQKVKMRRHYRYVARMIQEDIDRLTAQQEAQRRQQKKLEKSYEDFMKLLTFVEFVEDDGFWRSEVVQIAAHTTPSGALEVELLPRSGNHTILFGRMEEIVPKFEKLLRFYRSGLQHIGWDEYRTIDIRYNDQVVCKK